MSKPTWSWQRRIAPAGADAWIARLQAAGCATWTLTERPGQKRALLAVYDPRREPIVALRELFGGQVLSIAQSKWLPGQPTPPTRINEKLEILHDKPRKKAAAHQLIIPHGLAFGSGEHGTTFMLLRALVRHPSGVPVPARVLDLGTGSGVLALAARRLGAKHIVATDFDPAAIRTARQNEALNFSTPQIRWRRADVKRLAEKPRHDLVLGNLFSGILIEAAKQITAAVDPNGQLWLSGILREQKAEVLAAYRAQGLRLLRATTRGKWVMLQFLASIREEEVSD
ncbi:MAG TPA: 50S ribosomal protein L11 methyltransferase [Candidatus Methylacidiphilales bacterium]|jgi:ribosomal protein L11 methyltransferase|nr:50S ribosomal protein L11 methyltransferase [Candidatus Methylacidiphilales bacterium]